MSSKNDIGDMVARLASQKEVDERVIYEALEAALVLATKRRYSDDVNIEVTLDNTGHYNTYRCWTVVADDALEDPEAEITLSHAHESDSNLKEGDIIREEVESGAFGRNRTAAQYAKQVITQKVREAKRVDIVKEYTTKINTLVTGVVKRVTRDFAFLDLGNNTDGVIPRVEMLPRENFRTNDRVRGLLYEVHYEPRGPQLYVSRTRPDMLIELFKIEVPEIGEQVN